MIVVDKSWQEAYPGAKLGVMVVDQVLSQSGCAALEDEKMKVITELRNRFGNKEELAQSFPFPVYRDYYKKYKKTYHVVKQVESVAFKEKGIPSVTPVVEAMFMAELKNGLLTAGHDFQAIKNPLTLKAATGEEQYPSISGKLQPVKAHDMMLADGEGVISSIIHGPDFRTRIVAETQKALFIIYAPEGIAANAIMNHLSDIYRYIRLAAPTAVLVEQKIY